jgi:hypothetical protein
MFNMRLEIREAVYNSTTIQSNITERIENKFASTSQQLEEIRRQQVSYIFCDCTIKFTSPYRFACFNKNGT